MLEIIKKRKSIRAYKDKAIKQEDLEKIKEAIQRAPTWKNKQCFEVIIIEDEVLRAKIGEIVNHNPCESAYTKAPYLFVFIADPTKSGLRDDKPYYMSDTAIAIDHAMLCATSLELGTCWVGVFPEKEIKDVLSIPEHYRIVALMPLGFKDEEPEIRPRRSIDEIFHKNIY